MLKWIRKLERRALQRAADRQAGSCYFAYGSNLSPAGWLEFCRWHDASPDTLVSVSTGWLPDMRLSFHYRSRRWEGGALDVIDAPGSAVPGVIFKASASAMALLDKKEGAPAFYRRYQTTALDEACEPCHVTTYKLVPRRVGDFIAPSAAYLDACWDGLTAHGLPFEALHLAREDDMDSVFPGYLFVYGSLMRGGRLHHILAPYMPREIQRAKVRGRLYGKEHPYPMLRPALGPDDWVWGEALTSAQLVEMLRETDDVEDFVGYLSGQSLYYRAVKEVYTPEGTRIGYAWCYQFAQSVAEESRIPSGDWRHQRTGREPG